jgi:NAD(P)-dependent dehydrogenase (short-subunit alcohol dehydrogenase family)
MTSIRFNDRVVVVTGAGGGLGRAYALEFARRGAAVVVNDLGGSGAGLGASQRAADQVVEEIRAAGGKAVANYDSVSTRAGGQAIIDSAMDAYGRVDAVVNNAGFLRNKKFEDLGDAELDAIIDVHLKAAFYVTQPAYRIMQKQKYGRVVFTASASGAFGSPEQTNYGAAKAGLLGLMHCLALEGRKHGVLANALLPTAGTRLMQEMSPEWYAEMLPQQAGMEILAPTYDPAYVMPMVVYLASEQCSTTRQIYSATGGRFARAFVAVTEGWYGPLEKPATVEDIAAQIATIEDTRRFDIPESVTDEGRPVLARRLQMAAKAS